MFVVLFNFGKKKQQKKDTFRQHTVIDFSRLVASGIMTTIHLVSISVHVDYNWQTINYIAVIVIIIISIEYIDLLNAQSVNDAHKLILLNR